MECSVIKLNVSIRSMQVKLNETECNGVYAVMLFI